MLEEQIAEHLDELGRLELAGHTDSQALWMIASMLHSIRSCRRRRGQRRSLATIRELGAFNLNVYDLSQVCFESCEGHLDGFMLGEYSGG